MTTDQSKVLFKIWLDPRLEPEWLGPKIFEHRLISHDEANKLQWKFLDLCQLIKPKDLCQRCDKLSIESIDNGHLCDACINNNFSEGCCDMDTSFRYSIHLRTSCSKLPSIIRFKSFKLELISDSKIIDAFKIISASGSISSYSIIDDIIHWHDLRFKGQGKTETSSN